MFGKFSIRLFALVSIISAPAIGRAVSFVGLGDLPGGQVQSQAQALSADGSTVVGGSVSARGSEGFIWDAAHGLRGTGGLPGWSDITADLAEVSADGSVVVGSSNSGDGFIWDATNGMRPLSGFPGSTTAGIYPTAVSADGRIVVGSDVLDRDDIFSSAEAFRWDATGGPRLLGDPPGGDIYSFARDVSADGNTVVGGTRNEAGLLRSFIWDSTSGMRILEGLPAGSSESAASAISADGSTIIGGDWPKEGQEHAYIWDAIHGTRRLSDPLGLGNFSSAARGVSSDGSVVVGSVHGPSAFDTNEAFIWDATNGMRKLSVVLESLGIDLTDWSLESVSGISADGRTIAGTGRRLASDRMEAWIAVIPEPSTALMMGLGLVCLAIRRREVGLDWLK